MPGLARARIVIGLRLMNLINRTRRFLSRMLTDGRNLDQRVSNSSDLLQILEHSEIPLLSWDL